MNDDVLMKVLNELHRKDKELENHIRHIETYMTTQATLERKKK